MIEPLFYFIHAPRDRVPRWVTLYYEKTKKFSLYIATKGNQKVCLLLVSNSLDVFNVFLGLKLQSAQIIFDLSAPFSRSNNPSWQVLDTLKCTCMKDQLFLNWFWKKCTDDMWWKAHGIKNMHNCILPIWYLINHN